MDSNETMDTNDELHHDECMDSNNELQLVSGGTDNRLRFKIVSYPNSFVLRQFDR